LKSSHYFETSCSSILSRIIASTLLACSRPSPIGCSTTLATFSLSSSLELTAQGVLEFVQEGLLHLAFNYLEKRRACGLSAHPGHHSNSQQLINSTQKGETFCFLGAARFITFHIIEHNNCFVLQAKGIYALASPPSLSSLLLDCRYLRVSHRQLLRVFSRLGMSVSVSM
jgi:hypothetical protein